MQTAEFYIPNFNFISFDPDHFFKTLRDPKSPDKWTSSMPTVSYDVNYIILNPDRLFKTVSDWFRCSKMLWRYVGIIQGCSNYVLYIISWERQIIVLFAQFLGCKMGII